MFSDSSLKKISIRLPTDEHISQYFAADQSVYLLNNKHMTFISYYPYYHSLA